MPTYEYACRDCGEHLEVVQSFRDDALTTCPTCDGELRKVFSAAGIIFKGSGWHIKDYKDGGKKAAASSSKNGDGGATGSDKADGGKTADSSSSSSDKAGTASTGKDGSGSGSSGDSASRKSA